MMDMDLPELMKMGQQLKAFVKIKKEDDGLPIYYNIKAISEVDVTFCDPYIGWPEDKKYAVKLTMINGNQYFLPTRYQSVLEVTTIVENFLKGNGGLLNNCF